MKLGSVDVYANHGVLALGAGTEIGGELELGGSAAVASTSHVLVATRGQAGLVRVALWRDVALRAGTEVLAATLTLEDQYLSVFDIEKVGVWSRSVGPPGDYRILLMVDDPGVASKVDVVLVSDDDNRDLPVVAGRPPLELVAPSGVPVDPSDQLGVILAGHDVPVTRLAVALKLILTTPDIKPPIRAYWLRLIGEWVRWLTYGGSVDSMNRLMSILSDDLDRLSVDSTDDQIVDVVGRALRQANALE